MLYLAAIFTTSVAPRDARRILCFGLETQQADICVHGQGYGIRLAWPGRARRSRALRSCLTGLLYGPHRHWVTAFAYSLQCTVHGVTASLLLGIPTMQTFKSYQMVYCTWCHRKPTTWYLHHANLQILSADVHGVTSSLLLVSPPCKPSNLIS